VECDLLLSHLHWDHVQGLPFFAPLYERTTRLRVWTAQVPDDGVLERVVRGLMSPAVFPIAFEHVGAMVEFCARPRAPWLLGGCEVDTLPVWHPGGAFGYRLRVDGASRLIYMPDNELRAPASPPAPARSELVEFCAGAGLLIHDSTYTAAEYGRRAGWGHSTLGDAVALALEAGVERLMLFHHAPGRSDAELDDLLDECRVEVGRRGGVLEVTAAMEGLSVEV
jgi:phosphoribosyl 1,2-cyclic phosphodiesterase